MTQQTAIINYIKEHGSITPMEAFEALGITKLATVVSDMRLHRGIAFVIEKETGTNRFGADTWWCRYSFPKDEE